VGFLGDGFSSILPLDAGNFGKVHAQYSLKVPVRIEIFDSRISIITHVTTWHTYVQLARPVPRYLGGTTRIG
jgi:hypothetical protein